MRKVPSLCPAISAPYRGQVCPPFRAAYSAISGTPQRRQRRGHIRPYLPYLSMGNRALVPSVAEYGSAMGSDMPRHPHPRFLWATGLTASIWRPHKIGGGPKGALGGMGASQIFCRSPRQHDRHSRTEQSEPLRGASPHATARPDSTPLRDNHSRGKFAVPLKGSRLPDRYTARVDPRLALSSEQSGRIAYAAESPAARCRTPARPATSLAPERAILPSRGSAWCRLSRCCRWLYEKSRTAERAPERIDHVPVGPLATAHLSRWPQCCHADLRQPFRMPTLPPTTPTPERAFRRCPGAGFAVRSLGSEPPTDQQALQHVPLALGLPPFAVGLAAAVERKPCAGGFSVRGPRHTVSRWLE